MSNLVVDVQNLSRSFGEKLALDNFSIQIPKGCVYGLVGENGAGKTTFLKHLLGLYSAQKGSVSVFGVDPAAEPVAVLSRVGYLSEDREMPTWMKVGEIIRYRGAFYETFDAGYAEELRKTFDLNPKQKVKSLSRGQLARVGLILALAHRPDLLLLDEPSSGLDPVVRRDILAAIIRTVADEGRTVVFSSHLLDEVQRVSDHVAMVSGGKQVLTAPVEEVLQTHVRMTVRFESPRDTPPRLESALSCHGEGAEWTVLCNGQREAVRQEIEQLQGEVVEEVSPTLDEIFVAKIGGKTAE
jgi:ABC-2 type transport system ATP-binding protein